MQPFKSHFQDSLVLAIAANSTKKVSNKTFRDFWSGILQAK